MMRPFKVLMLIMVLGILLSSFVYAQKLDNLSLKAHYPLSHTANDTTGNYDPMTLINTPFQGGGIYCNGNYTGTDPDSCDAVTPDVSGLHFESFAISAMFKVDNAPDIRRPVFVCGKYNKWASTFIDPDSTVGFGRSGIYYAAQSSGVKMTPGTWHELIFTHDSTEGIGRLYLDGTAVDSATFQNDHQNDRFFSITHGSVGLTFKGFLKDLKIYSKSLTGIEQDSLALVALYNSTDGANWMNNSNWFTGTVDTWYGITLTENRVTHIEMENNNLNGPLPMEIGNLTNLVRINLRDNHISGSIPPEIGNLINLTELNLHENQISGSIPAEIGSLTKLTQLKIQDNQFEGAIPTEMGNLTNLTELNMGENQFSGPIPPEIGNLSNLKILNLWNNQLSDSIPPEIGNMNSLKDLNFNVNQLSGPIPPVIGNLVNLTDIKMNSNQLNGPLPPEIGNCTQLEMMDLIGNQLSGAIPFEIGNLVNLVSLYLNNNQFIDSIPVSIGNLQSLRSLSLQNNQLSGSIPEEIGLCASLRRLGLSTNQLTGLIPSEIGNCAELYEIFVSENQLLGSVPGEIVNCAYLEYIGLDNNQLTNLPDITSIVSLKRLSVYNNRFTFEDIEPNMGISNFDYAPQDSVGIKQDTTVFMGSSLTLSVDVGGEYNQYAWFHDNVKIEGADSTAYTIHPAMVTHSGSYICHITNTLATDLTLYCRPIHVMVEGNFVLEQDSLALVAFYESTDGTNWTNKDYWLTGPVSTWFGVTVEGNRVIRIELDQNNLNGLFPAEIGNLTGLTHLLMRINDLHGPLPPQIGSLTSLIELDLYQNAFTDTLPAEIGDMNTLQTLNISDNDFIGHIPKEIGNLTYLSTFAARKNTFIGSIPEEIGNLDQLQFLYLYKNQMSGSIPQSLCNCSNLRYLYLYENDFLGSIPDEIVNLVNLERLYIQSNQFTGLPDLSTIPEPNDLKIQNNRFTFEDIEPNIGIPLFEYSPQDSVGEAQDTTITEGTPLTLAIEVGGDANQYQWYKNNAEIADADQSELTIEVVALSDSGIYTCEITNTIATELILYSRPIVVHTIPGSGVKDHLSKIPKTFRLLQNYPNPFNPETTIEYHLPRISDVMVIIYDIKGQWVFEKKDDNKPAGVHHVKWNGRNQKGRGTASGIYICYVAMKDRNKVKILFSDVKKMMLMK